MLRRTLLAVAFGLMSTGLSSTGAMAAEPAEWQIGFITATSGPLKQTGDSTAIAVQVAVDDVNAKGGIAGRKIHLIRYDTASDPKQASVAVRTLAQDDKVLAIIGPLSSSETSVAINDAERQKLLMLPYSSSAPGLTKGFTYTWRLSAGEDKQFSRLLQGLARKNVAMKTADVIYVSDDRIASITGGQVYPPLLKKAGVTIQNTITFNTNSFDVAAQVAQVVRDNPDLVALAANFDQAVVILRELHRQNYKGRVIGSQLFAEPNLVELFGRDADGMIFASGFWRGHDAATEAFSARFAKETAARGLHKLGPHHVDAQAYDTVFLLKQAIEASGVTGDPTKLATERVAVRDAMKGIRFSGVLGDNICFTGTDAELPGYIIQVQDGQWVLFDAFPPDACPAG